MHANSDSSTPSCSFTFVRSLTLPSLFGNHPLFFTFFVRSLLESNESDTPQVKRIADSLLRLDPICGSACVMGEMKAGRLNKAIATTGSRSFSVKVDQWRHGVGVS